MLVYFIGGVTYMEIAALRFLNKQRECEDLENCNYLPTVVARYVMCLHPYTSPPLTLVH